MQSAALDDIDFRIINVLVRNGRTPFASRGAEVGLSPHGAADRVRRLQRAGIITGFTALVDLGSVGRGLDASSTCACSRAPSRTSSRRS